METVVVTIPGEGTAFNNERTAEAYDILFRRGLAKLVTEMAMTDKEAKFIESMAERFDRCGPGTRVTIGQLGWLRDLLQKYG